MKNGKGIKFSKSWEILMLLVTTPIAQCLVKGGEFQFLNQIKVCFAKIFNLKSPLQDDLTRFKTMFIYKHINVLIYIGC